MIVMLLRTIVGTKGEKARSTAENVLVSDLFFQMWTMRLECHDDRDTLLVQSRLLTG